MSRVLLVPNLIQRRALLDGDAIAVSSGGTDVSYGQLNARANRLARCLRAHGVRPESVVAVRLPRGPAFVTAVLGVLKSGGAYLPLDPSLPAARLEHMVRAAGAGLVITNSVDLPPAQLEGAALLEVGRDGDVPGDWPQDDLDPWARPDNLAYVIFTSGSTGLPKPVAVQHRSLTAHAVAVTARLGLTAADRVLQFASAGFDVAGEEIFPTLACGATVVVLPDPAILPAELERFLAGHGVTVANLPSPAWSQWATDLEDEPRQVPAALRLLVVGSDTAYTHTLAAWREHCAVPVVNAYGLTETTITISSACFDPADGLPAGRTLPVGQPLPGSRAYVLDAELRELPPGEQGELYVGGLALARGYHARPELTAHRFVPDHLSGNPGARLYRTGDAARIDASGQIELLGRVDEQVKIRGYRVEVSEVASVLATHEHVGRCHVLAVRSRPDDEVSLVGYVVPQDAKCIPAASALRTHLAVMLPGYMIPSAFMIVDDLPVTAAGKIDVASLPAFEPAERRASVSYQPPVTPVEQAMAAVWEEVLHVSEAGIDDDLFELGGHSLTLVRIAGRLKARSGITVSVRDLVSYPTIRELARHADTGVADAGLPPMVCDPGAVTAPLTLQQEQVWFLAKLVPESIAYHAQTTIRLVGPLSADVLDQAITEITRRHAILRTTFEEADGRPGQVVHPAAPVRAERVSLPADELESFVDGLLGEPFDLSVLPLVRWTLVRLGETEHELVLIEHHLVHDGWSFALLMRELTALYNAFESGSPCPLAAPSLQYGDYARWQREALPSPELTRQLDYWTKRLADPCPPLALPYDRPRPKVQTFGGQTIRIELPPSLPGAIRAFCRSARTTLFTAMYAAFAVLLHRYSGERDIAVGSAFASRQQPQTHDMLGMCVNTVVLRCDIAATATFRDVVRQCHEIVLDAGANQELPFGELVRALNPDRDLTRNPLTQILFSANDSPLPDLNLGDASGTIFERGNGSSKLDLDVVVIPRAESKIATGDEADDRIMLLWEYNVDLFDAATMHQMIGGYFRLLEAAVTAPDQGVADLPLVSDVERRQALSHWNPPARPSTFSAVHVEVQAQARSTPGALAVCDGNDQVSYAELVRRAGMVAAVLRGLGAGPGTIIGVCLPRGIELVVAELGILMAGAAYLPMDPDNPRDRIEYMLGDAGALAAITSQAHRERLPDSAQVLRIDQLADVEPAPARPVGPEDAAYAIYTSGSTGRPKGVLVQHGSLANLASWRREEYGIEPADRITMFASPGFDPTVSDLWPTLTGGASVHVPDPEIRMLAHRLKDWMLAESITMAELPTPLAESLLLLPWPDQCPFRLLIAGGDRLHLRPAPELPFLLSNEYGPTENTATSTWEIVSPDEPNPNPPIGRPISGTHAYVLDAELRPVPPGAPGELYLGGLGVARGYLGRPELTAERFVPHPFPHEPGARLYRTGDQARQLRDGRLEFLGRVDAQIKLRGYRIEPGEIVARLRGHPQISDAYVTSDGSRLIGYLTVSGSQPDPAELRAFLARDLPAFMVPAAFVFLEKLPTSASGKVDPRRLPEPASGKPGNDLAPPSTDLEHRLAQIWREVLGVESVGVTDSFFDLGGHSLLLGQVHYRLTSELGRELAMVTLFEHPTIAALAGYLSGAVPASPDGDRRGHLRTGARSVMERRRALIRPEGT